MNRLLSLPRQFPTPSRRAGRAGRWLLSRLLVGLLWLMAPPVRAGGDPLPVGARALGMGYAAAALTDHWALFNNVGGLARVREVTLMTHFSSQFGIEGLQALAVGAALPTRYGTAGVGIQRFGDALYSEHLVGLAFAHTIEKVSLGLKINYLQVAAQGLGSKGAVVVELGGVVQLLPQLTFGMHAYNLTQAKLADYQDERVPTVLKAGLAYTATTKLLLAAEVSKDVDFPAVARFGLEYEVVKHVYLRTGVSSQPFGQHYGAGLWWRQLRFDYAVTTHPRLGFSHHLSLALALGKKVVSKPPVGSGN